jgi:CheY-like chemotaxis protein
MARILSISYDPALLHTREIILMQAGYEIKSALGLSEAIEACNEHYDLMVMGHSIPESDKREVVRELRNRGCHSPILSLNRFGERPIPEAAKTVEPDPKLVLEAIRSLLSGWFKFWVVVQFEIWAAFRPRTNGVKLVVMDRPKNQDDKAPDNRTKEQVRNDSIQEIDEYVKSKEEKIREDVNEGAARNWRDRGN